MKTKGELVISPDLFDLMLLQVLTLRAQMACSPFPSAVFGSGTECFFKTSSMLHRSAERFMTRTQALDASAFLSAGRQQRVATDPNVFQHQLCRGK
jgi:hypothetical protein